MKFSPKDLLAMLLLAFLGSCDGADLPPGPPEPMGLGLLAVVLDTPNSNDGAFLVTLTGGPVDSLRRGQLRVISSDAGPSQRRVIVSGLVRASKVLRFWVPERGNVDNYTAVLEQAAERAQFAQQDISSYSLSVVVD